MMSVCTHLMFQGGKAQAAVDLYASVFPGFKVMSVEKYGPDDPVPGLIKIAKIAPVWFHTLDVLVRRF